MDEIYQKLINRIPEDLTATDVCVGNVWIVVNASCGCGAASVYDEGHATGRMRSYEGRSLKDLAQMIDSPVPYEQGISMAAINAYYNQFERLKELEDKGLLALDETTNSFVLYGQQAEGKDVAFVGHFCGLEMHMAKAASISILEKRPQPGDLPAEMAPEVIPGKDIVIMTGATLANCTATGLLSLCRKTPETRAIFVGPTTTLSEVLFEYGASELAGTIITDPKTVMEAVLSPDDLAIFKSGQKVRIVKKEIE